jgi:hypothetical protein
VLVGRSAQDPEVEQAVRALTAAREREKDRGVLTSINYALERLQGRPRGLRPRP